MRIANTLIWFDEDPGDLRRMILSLAGFVDALVAIDGAFERFPSRVAASAPEQAAAIVDACAETEIELLLHRPNEKGRWFGYHGEEVAKRTACLRACGLLQPDWILVCDADMEILSDTKAKARIRELLARTQLDAAVADILGHYNDPMAARVLFRWSEGLWYDRAHWVLRDADGRLLWGPLHRANAAAAGLPPVEPALDLRFGRAAFRLGHEEKHDGWRRSTANAYYRRREEEDLEPLTT